MNLTPLTDDQLLLRTESLVREERELLATVLHHLREIERRRLFSKLKYKSLFDYAVKHLKYSADQAARRISAMRLLREMPEIETRIESGALTLTNLGLAQSFFRKEDLSKSAKTDFLTKIENVPSREVERLVLTHASDPIKHTPDCLRPISQNHIEVKFVADAALADKLERLKGLLAHKQSGEGLAKLIDTLCDIAIEKLVPVEKPKSATKVTLKTNSSLNSAKSAAPLGQRVRKTIPAQVKRNVRLRAGHKCLNCASTYALEIDHIQPKALGGSDDPDNLRLLCRSCNQRAAIEQLGRQKMQRYIDPPI